VTFQYISFNVVTIAKPLHIAKDKIIHEIPYVINSMINPDFHYQKYFTGDWKG
jgi:hypothetical protein